MLRHTFVTTMLDAGVDLRDVQIAARHADPRTTMRYDRAGVAAVLAGGACGTRFGRVESTVLGATRVWVWRGARAHGMPAA